jgi:hypothetical protein
MNQQQSNKPIRATDNFRGSSSNNNKSNKNIKTNSNINILETYLHEGYVTNTIHIDILKNTSGDLKDSTTYKCSQTSSELDNFLDSLDLNKPSSFEHYEFFDIPRGKIVTFYPEHDGTKELDHNTCEGLSCPNNMEFDHDYTKKFKRGYSQKVDKEGCFMDWNVTDLTDFVKNENVIEILTHNTQNVSIVIKQNKDNFLDGFNDTKMKGSETSFINDTFRFCHDEPDNMDVTDSEIEKLNDICTTDTSSKPIIKNLLSSNDLNITNLEIVNSSFKTLKSYIDMYLSECIPNTYKFSYLKKLMNEKRPAKY